MPHYEEADVVVIGGGIMGCSTAYELAKRGSSVILIERGFIGGEASGRNGGAVLQQMRDPAELPLAIESVKIWKEMKEDLAWDVEYRQGGSLYIFNNPHTLNKKKKQLEYSQSKGLDVRFLGPEETRSLVPMIRKDLDILGASYCPTDGTANPLLVTKAIGRAAKRRGALIKEHEPLERLVLNAGRVIAAVTTRCEYRAEVFVNTAGAWAKSICNQVGLDYPLEIKRSQLMVTEPLPPVFAEFISADEFLPYYRQSLNGSIHIGVPSTPVENFNKMTTYSAFRAAGESAAVLFPFLEKVNIVHSWAGLTNWTADAVCIIDKAPRVEGMFLAAGHSGHGFCLGPITGRLLSEWILDGAPSVDLTDLRWTRFDRIYLAGSVIMERYWDSLR
jgi:sarcosine oxidase subunit beta